MEYFRALRRCGSYLLVSQGVFDGTYLGDCLFQSKCLTVVFIFHFSFHLRRIMKIQINALYLPIEAPLPKEQAAV